MKGLSSSAQATIFASAGDSTGSSQPLTAKSGSTNIDDNAVLGKFTMPELLPPSVVEKFASQLPTLSRPDFPDTLPPKVGSVKTGFKGGFDFDAPPTNFGLGASGKSGSRGGFDLALND